MASFAVADAARLTCGPARRGPSTVDGVALVRRSSAVLHYLRRLDGSPTRIDVVGTASIDLITGLLAALQMPVDLGCHERPIRGPLDRDAIECLVLTTSDDSVESLESHDATIYLDQLPTEADEPPGRFAARATIRLRADGQEFGQEELIERIAETRLSLGFNSGSLVLCREPWWTSAGLIDGLLAPLAAGAHVVVLGRAPGPAFALAMRDLLTTGRFTHVIGADHL
jgi:hypothetical protein